MLDIAAVGALTHEHVVPALVVKDVAHQGRSHHEAHLVAGETGLELRHHLLADVIALLDFHPVGRDEAASRGEHRRGENQNSRHDRSTTRKRYIIAETPPSPPR